MVSVVPHGDKKILKNWSAVQYNISSAPIISTKLWIWDMKMLSATSDNYHIYPGGDNFTTGKGVRINTALSFITGGSKQCN